MATKKITLIEEAQALGLEATEKNTIAELEAMIAGQAREVDEVSLEEAQSEAEIVDEQAEPQVAKAGKRSAKAIAATEAEELRQERKVQTTEDEEKPKGEAPKVRSRLERRGKQFRTKAELIEADKVYTLEQALDLAQKTSHTKFDATVELHVNLGVNPRHADQNIRDNLVLPAGTGKTVNVAVLDDDVFAKLDKGTIDFDILIATPQLMPKLGKYARLLGPKGLMPNPKSGTVTTDIDKAVAEAKAGRVEYRVDTTGIVHLGIGKVSFSANQLLDNAQAVMTSIKNNKPNSVKGNYFKSAHVTTSMGPSIPVDIATIS